MIQPRAKRASPAVLDDAELARRALADLPPSDGAKGKLGIADLKEGPHAAKEAFG
jgi:hypothetical protein